MGSKRIAASIKYSDGDRAPRLSAYGEGPLADRIRPLLPRQGVPIQGGRTCGKAGQRWNR